MIRARLLRGPVALLLVLVLGLPALAVSQGNGLSRAQLAARLTQNGGRVIVTMRSQQGGAAMRAPGSPEVSPNELRDLDVELRGRGMIRNTKRLDLVGAVAGEVNQAQLDALLASPLVAMVEPDVLIPMQDNGPTVPLSLRAQTTPWGVERVQAPQAWGIVGNGSGIKVGIIDSGGDTDHPDLQWAGGYNAMTGSTSPSAWDDNVSQCNGHGTHVAGTVAARDNDIGVVGVAPGVQIYALKVFEIIDGSCLAWASSQINALNWAVSQNIDVVNVSIGGTTMLASYANAISNAAAQGTYLVAAAGNSGGAMYYPALYDDAIAIAALTSSNARASYSAYGQAMDFAAPGSGISSTMPGGGYGSKNGTSMASPHAAGVVALMLAQNRSLTLGQIKAKLQSGALDVNAGGWDVYTGWGLLQAASSLQGGTVVPPPPADPLTLVMSPRSRSHTVAQGGSGGSSNSTVQLSGSGSVFAAWTATKRKSWTTLAAGGASGMGGGTVSWTRNTAGLAPGTYVDTIAVTVAGAVGSPGLVIDTLVITGSGSPLTLAVSPGSRNVSAQIGTAAAGANATVTLGGTGATTTNWTATKRKAWTTLTTASGTGSGTVAWNRNTSGLAVGTYVDTITIAASGASGSPTRVIDTLRITAAPVPLTLAVSPGSRNVSAQIDTPAGSGDATVTITGDGASSTGWTATKRKAWTTITAASGTGSGTVRWNRNTTGLAVGTYVDTITIAANGASGSPTRVIDTLRITAAPVPLTLAVSPGSRNVSAQIGTPAAGANATVTLAGDDAATTTWTATKRKTWTTLTTASGTGSGTVAWNRNTSGLAVGIYVDTITIAASGASGSPTRVIDTLRITAAPVPLALDVSPGSRRVSAQIGTAAGSGDATITITGDGASSTGWTATKRKTWTTLTTASGTGSGTVRWNRNTAGLAVGTYVDTITVVASGAAGSPARVIDTLVVTAAPVPLVLAVGPTSRYATTQIGTPVAGADASITLTGDGASTAAWTATKRKAWTTLTVASGSGSGSLSWSRNTTGLAVGTHVDTITVTAVGATGSQTRVIDTLVITAAPVPLTIAVGPGSRSISAQQGTPVAGATAAVTLSGDGSATALWTATKRQPWTTLTTMAGTGSGTVAWNRNAAGLAPGVYVDTITVSAIGATGSQTRVIDTMTITSTPVALAIAVSPSSRRAATEQGSGALLDETADVTVSGSGSATATWTASSRRSWTAMTLASGVGSGLVRWQRNPAGLPVGLHVDTITVSLAGAAPAMVIDTFEIRAAQVTVAIRMSPNSKKTQKDRGNYTVQDSVYVDIDGSGANNTSWVVSKRASYTQLSTSGGVGSRWLYWSRRLNGMSAGTYVDTLTVTGGGTSARLIDSLVVSLPEEVVLGKKGGKTKVRRMSASSTSSLASVELDSVAIQSVSDGQQDGAAWVATSTAGWLAVNTGNGSGPGQLRFQRQHGALSNGVHVDTIVVALAAESHVRAFYVDTVEVVTVPAPEAASAARDLFRGGGQLSPDQRAALDGEGNNNGRFDLGDFLAWVQRSNIRLSPSVMAEVQEAMKREKTEWTVKP